MEKNQVIKIINKYYYLELDEKRVNQLINIHKIKTYQQLELFIQEIVILVLNNMSIDNLELINRETLISNFITHELTFSIDFNDNINQITKLYNFYDLIKNKQDLLALNTTLLSINNLLKKIVKNINKYYYKFNINDNYLQSLIDAYSKIEFPIIDEIINTDNYKLYTQDIKKLPKISEEERYELLLKAKKGDLIAYQKFIESNLKLVISVAFHYKEYADITDLISCGNIGLIEAYNHFNPDLGFSFSTYAIYWIKNQIFIYLNKNRLIKIPINDYPLIVKIRKAIDSLANKRLPLTDKNIAIETSIPIKQVHRIRSIQLNVDSLDVPTIEGEEETSLLNIIPDDCNIEEEYIEQEKKEKIKTILNQMLENELLTQRELQILLMHTGFINDKVYTYDEIGEKYHISRQRVDQIFKAILIKIRNSQYFKRLAEYLNDDNFKNKILKKSS